MPGVSASAPERLKVPCNAFIDCVPTLGPVPVGQKVRDAAQWHQLIETQPNSYAILSAELLSQFFEGEAQLAGFGPKDSFQVEAPRFVAKTKLYHHTVRCPYRSSRRKAKMNRTVLSVLEHNINASQGDRKRCTRTSRGESKQFCECAFSLSVQCGWNLKQHGFSGFHHVHPECKPEWKSIVFISLHNWGKHTKRDESSPCHGPLAGPNVAPRNRIPRQIAQDMEDQIKWWISTGMTNKPIFQRACQGVHWRLTTMCHV